MELEVDRMNFMLAGATMGFTTGPFTMAVLGNRSMHLTWDEVLSQLVFSSGILCTKWLLFRQVSLMMVAIPYVSLICGVAMNTWLLEHRDSALAVRGSGPPAVAATCLSGLTGAIMESRSRHKQSAVQPQPGGFESILPETVGAAQQTCSSAAACHDRLDLLT
eukprot:CAMPEP_0197628770 /NCGR_PEP_ID=MMETSP1338-20131121/6926_1 /TAXON_ID=43686 ORGANISM="Pelagodinium beii, Strain RCC1491" /NCGR_SAMPLE_ID=MMETSP1338 /ASSEMBLY_ACC=CAM_ASM_000754 /LENGTH=162 /DNA_ID=CAMNT_0043199763 /DNA_START=311 /DNA_END=799 /DNA_ORIENTATION=-